MKNIIKFIGAEILYNGHLQSLSAVSVVYISDYLINKAVNLPLLVVVYLIFQIIFLFDRYKDIDKDKFTNSVRSQHLNKYKNKIPFLLTGSIAFVALIHYLFSNTLSLSISMVIILFGTLYNLYLKGFTKFIPLFKNFYVASFYALIAYFPFIFMNQKIFINIPLIIISTSFFLQLMFDQILLDTKDLDSDKVNGLLTFPVLFNKKRTLNFLVQYNLLIFGLLFFVSLYVDNSILTFLFICALFLNRVQLNLFKIKPTITLIISAGKLIFWAMLFSVIINIV